MKYRYCLFFLSLLLGNNSMASTQINFNQSENLPPTKSVKILFIHHSVGGHWLAHDNGGLVNELNKNNYYVNDVTYGWEPSGLTSTISGKTNRFFLKIKHKVTKTSYLGAFEIGNRTDIGQMPEWFLGPDSDLIMSAIYKENLETSKFGDHSNGSSTRPLSNPGYAIENQVIMFKSCFPNTMLRGSANDPAAKKLPSPVFSAGSDTHTVANTKKVFNDLLDYFKNHPDKFFVIVTPPPQSSLLENGIIARSFSNWLVHDWLKENKYFIGNVMVFDLFNVLTSGHGNNKNDAGEEQGNHHRIRNGEVQHIINDDYHLLVYPTSEGNDHPSPEGLQKATEEFVPLLNYYYSLWYNNLKNRGVNCEDRKKRF